MNRHAGAHPQLQIAFLVLDGLGGLARGGRGGTEPSLLEVEPDVLVVTADHSTPAAMGSPSRTPDRLRKYGA